MSRDKTNEDYLEAILLIQRELGEVRSVDVAHHMGVTKPSVTYATKRLKQEGFITMEENGLIHFTAQGEALAQGVYERHQTLTRLFVTLGVDEATARADACKVEHDISEATFEALRRHTRFLEGEE
ncbi:MAG: iron dependent repressor, metal binding and dimerization domain protein [Tissierellia bacterium]|nr:iron dependent repressor, metal binding and dimerization domain protein [Tissierellia bacterium]